MSVIYILAPMALLFAAGAALAFVWSAQKGQMDDLVTPALRILNDEEGRTARSPDPSPSDSLPPTPSER